MDRRDSKEKATTSTFQPSQQSLTASNSSKSDEFFNKPHTITALVLMLASLVYVAMNDTTVSNTKMGLIAMTCVFIVQGAVLYPDGLFLRPHPIMWRLVLAFSTVYQMFLTYLLFQSVDDARHLFTYYDSSLGVRLPERSYATNCELSSANIFAQLDEFVLAHVLGWVAKAIMFRDYWICWILSVMFEVLEYSLQHQLPNFAECWWDHWILDVFLCNWLGLEIGMRICEYFEMKTYSWRGIKQIPSYSGKVKRAFGQFTPYSWVKFDWQVTTNIRHFIMVLVLITIFLQGELNAFYLKYLLWIPPQNIINPLRLIFFFFAGCPAIREAYQYVTDPKTKRLGPQAWITIANIMTESLVCFKYGKNEFLAPFPREVIIFWSLFCGGLLMFAFWQFAIIPKLDDSSVSKERSPPSESMTRRRSSIRSHNIKQD